VVLALHRNGDHTITGKRPSWWRAVYLGGLRRYPEPDRDRGLGPSGCSTPWAGGPSRVLVVDVSAM
jgi:hypothetical protein